MLDLHGKRFTLISNTAGDAKPGETIFTFEQSGRAIRANYDGGGVLLGTIVGQIENDGSIYVLFQQVTSTDRLCGGEGRIKVEAAPNGKLRFAMAALRLAAKSRVPPFRTLSARPVP